MTSRRTVALIAGMAALAGCGGGGSAAQDAAPALREPEKVTDDLTAGAAAAPTAGKPVAKVDTKERRRSDDRAATSRDSRKSERSGRPSSRDGGTAPAGGKGGAGGTAKLTPGVKVVGKPGQIAPSDAARIDRVKDAVRQLAAAISKGDSSACTRLMTQRYVEQITGMRGQAAVARCRVNMSHSKGRVVVERIDGVRLESDTRALIQFVSSANGRSGGTQILRLIETGGRWLIHEALRAAA